MITVFSVDLQIESYHVKAIAAAIGVLFKGCNRLHLSRKRAQSKQT